MTDIAALLERVEKADDQSLWQLNKDIGIALDGLPETGMPVPNYAGSIDSALALVEKCQPGAEFEITTLYGVAQVSLPLNFSGCCDIFAGRRVDGNIPLAILEALLRSLTGRTERG